jgi:beta-glucan synthesis-associated protein KRE6
MVALSCAWLLAFAAAAAVGSDAATSKEYRVKSGIKIWVDPDTPDDRQTYTSSRGRPWTLVMSDEFNTPGRDFRPGKDHIWTSIEKPDGVNRALEYYSHNMTSTKCDDDGTCYYYIKVQDEHIKFSTYNMYTNPPGYQDVNMYYRAAMVQSWNKFCFQGGMLEVRAQLPGAVSKKSGNPDIVKGPSSKTTPDGMPFYPTWPGIWMMGNLGRAIFSASTNRMWPYSYNRCEPDVFNPKNQRISACDDNPGYGLNPNQGRGAPEIDLLEGGGTDISSSLQIGPGMPKDFRLFPVNAVTDATNVFCLYSGNCLTPGANHPGIPAALYAKRGHKSWYQGLRYQANPFCAPDPAKKQTYETVAASLKAGVTVNTCTPQTCPGSKDGYADLSLVDGKGPAHWGINYNGTCFPVMNAYTGAFLCDPDNQDKQCETPRPDSQPKSNIMKEFNYQMDAISSNWPVHVGAYLDFLVYQIEWVTGKNGYVRWMLDGHPIFEVTSEAFENVPQDAKKSNPQKIMLEEPMYLIFNVALSSSWGAKPINTNSVCRGDGKNELANRICDEFPLYMKIDYVRLYQDLAKDLDADNLMAIGCDPKTHPTKEWIKGHIDEYQDFDNLAVDVSGGAFCNKDDDCTIFPEGDLQYIKLITGKCEKKRCVCTNGDAWGGPRCTIAMDASNAVTGVVKKIDGYGPPISVAGSVAALVLFLTTLSVWASIREEKRAQAAALRHAVMMEKPVPPPAVQQSPVPGEQQRESVAGAGAGPAKVDYSRNFV